MFSTDTLKNKMSTYSKEFNFKDIFGFSALMFGLLLSNTSTKNVEIEPTTLANPIKHEAVEEKKITPKEVKSNSQKKLSQKSQKKRLIKTIEKNG